MKVLFRVARWAGAAAFAQSVPLPMKYLEAAYIVYLITRVTGLLQWLFLVLRYCRDLRVLLSYGIRFRSSSNVWIERRLTTAWLSQMTWSLALLNRG